MSYTPCIETSWTVCGGLESVLCSTVTHFSSSHPLRIRCKLLGGLPRVGMKGQLEQRRKIGYSILFIKHYSLLECGVVS